VDEDKPYVVDNSVASENEEDELLDIPALIKTSRLSSAAVEEQERKISPGTHHPQASVGKNQEQDMQSLMQYAHINTTQFSKMQEDSEELEQMEEVIDDDCLMGVLRRDEGEADVGGVAYIFKKTSRPKAEQVLEKGRVEIKEDGIKSSFFK
jgi:hypothetical protein